MQLFVTKAVGATASGVSTDWLDVVTVGTAKPLRFLKIKSSTDAAHELSINEDAPAGTTTPVIVFVGSEATLDLRHLRPQEGAVYKVKLKSAADGTTFAIFGTI
jgi:hypothetical protein